MEKWEFIQINRICEKMSFLIKLMRFNDLSIQQEKARKLQPEESPCWSRGKA